MSARSVSLITVSVPTKKEGLEIAQKLLKEKHIACAQILGPVSSHFRWNGRISSAEEYILLCKTTRTKTRGAVKIIEELHSYSCPVIEILPVTISNAKTMQWLTESIL